MTHVPYLLLQARSDLHVYGHTHVNTDMPLQRMLSTPQQQGPGNADESIRLRRYVHHSLEGWRQPGLVCIWDGDAFAQIHVPLT